MVNDIYKKEKLSPTVHKIRTKYGQNIVLTSSTVKRVIEKLRKTGSIGDAKHIVRPKTDKKYIKNNNFHS